MNGQFQAKAAERGGALAALLTVRRADEERAERALAEAVAARALAEAEATRLVAAVAEARAALASRRGEGAPAVERGAEALARRRFLERLEATVRACEATVTSHARERAHPAREAEAAGRAAHLRARTRRELVERAMERREEARRRELDRRAEAAVDDLRHDRARRTRDDC